MPQIEFSVPKLIEIDQGPVPSFYKQWIWTFSLLSNIIPDSINNLNNFGSANFTRKGWNDHEKRSFLKNQDEWVEEYTKQIHLIFLNLIDNFSGDTQKSFTNNWPWIQPGNVGGVSSYTNIVCDLNAHKMSKHLDNRKTVFAAILNLTENNEGTKFWDYKNPDRLLYASPGTKGHGIIFMNTAGSLHDINVEQTTPRLTAQTQLSLYIK